jgi:hypothetical protein
MLDVVSKTTKAEAVLTSISISQPPPPWLPRPPSRVTFAGHAATMEWLMAVLAEKPGVKDESEGG